MLNGIFMDKTDPICGMQGTIPAHGHYFCSIECLKKYEAQHHLPHVAVSPRWYHKKLLWIVLLVLAIPVLNYLFLLMNITFLEHLNMALWDYFKLIWWALLLGFFLGGIIDYFIPATYISKYLAHRGWKSIIFASLLGFLFSACSHGLLALSIQFYKKGAGIPAVVSFLLASPWANFSMTIMFFAFFGVKATLFFIGSAILIAITTGLIYQFLDRHDWIEKNPYTLEESEHFAVWQDLRKRWHGFHLNWQSLQDMVRGVLYGMWSLAQMVLWWILLGILLASLIQAFVPATFLQQYLSASFTGLVLTLLIATVIEICSEGSAPLAFEIFRQTGAFGNAFAFLMAGVVTDYTEIGLLWTNIGKRTAWFLPLIAAPQVILIAWLFNQML